MRKEDGPWLEVVNKVNYNGNPSGDITTYDMFLGVAYWNGLGSKMRLDMGVSPDVLSHRAVYDFSLEETNFYALNMSNEQVLIHTEGTASPGMYSYHNGSSLSTWDADHDTWYSSCANNSNKAAWWYGSCWSGSFWGGGGQSFQDAPSWTGSGSEYFDYGSIWIKGEWIAEPASLTTDSVTDTGLFSARVYGKITGYGNTLPEAHGICWNNTGNPVVSDNVSDEGVVQSAGFFYSLLEDLQPNTTYFARSWARNAAGTVYGGEIQFTTLPDTILPDVMCKDTSLYLNSTGKLTLDPSLIDDGTTDNHEVAQLYVKPPFITGSNLGESTVWLFAEDVAGNLDSCSAVISLEDNLSPVAFAENAMETPLLWNTLRSELEVENSLTGPGGSLVGAAGFDSIVKYGTGITPNTGNAGSGVDFPTGTVAPDSGSIEFWAKFYDKPTPFSHGVYGFINANHWSHNVLSFTWYNPDLLQFILSFNGTLVTAETHGFNPELNKPIHLACVWNRQGIDGSSDYMRVYVNDSLVATNSTENNWGDDNSVGNFRVATTWDNNFSVNRYSLENIQVWETARTGFLSNDMEITEWDTARFTAASSFDNDGIAEYRWSFNDGIKDTLLYGINPEYRFDYAGNYPVTLDITDSTGNSGSDTLNLKVNVRDMSLSASSGTGGQISPEGDTVVQNHSTVDYSI
ncbi:MAG: PKD domain-containing protein, partial [Bacteroidales bacterium]